MCWSGRLYSTVQSSVEASGPKVSALNIGDTAPSSNATSTDAAKENPSEVFLKLINEAKVESAWKYFVSLSSPGESEELPLPTQTNDAVGSQIESTANLDQVDLKTILELMFTIASAGMKDAENIRRLTTIAKYVRGRSLTEEDYNQLLILLAKGRCFHDCDDVVEDMKRLGVKVSEKAVDKMTYYRLADRKISDALEFSRAYYEELGIRSPESFYSHMISGFVAAGLVENALEALNAKRKAGYAPSGGDYRHILSGMALKRDLEAMETFKDSIMNEVSELTPTITAAFVFAFCRLDFDKTKHWFHEHQRLDMQKTEISPWNSMLKSLITFKTLDEAVDFFADMKTSGPAPDINTFHILMDAFVKRDEHETARALFDQSFKYGNPNTITFSILMNSCVRNRDIESAMRTLDSMKGAEIAPNVVTYSTLINGYCKVNDIDIAMDIYNHVKNSGMKLDSVICTTLMFGTAFHGRYDDAFAIYQDIKSNELEMNEYTYTALIYAFSKRGDMDTAKELFKRMKEEGFETIYSYNALLSGYVATNDPEGAFELVSDMKEKFSELNVGTYNILMELASVEGRVDNILKFFHIVIKDPAVQVVDSRTISRVIKLLGKHGNISAMKTTFNALILTQEQEKLQLDKRCWVTYISKLAELEDYDSAKIELIEMINRGFIPSDGDMTNILRPFKMAGLYDTVEDLVKIIEEASHSPNVVATEQPVKKSPLYYKMFSE